MTELSDRLHVLANDATRGVELLPPHLARRVRQRRQHRLRIGAVAATAAAVVVVGWVTLLPLQQHNTRVVVLSPPTTVPGPITPPLSAMSSVALTQAAQAGEPAPQSGMVVATTMQAAETLANNERKWPTDTTEVYLVVLSGHFQCGTSCFAVSTPSPTGSTLTLILGRRDLHVVSFGLSDRVIDLSALGSVYQLNLTPTVAVPQVVSMPVDAAANALTSLGLVVSTHQQQDSGIPVGVVISQHPSASTLLPPGATVTLSVSQGP